MSPLIAAVDEVDSLKGDHFLVQDKAQETRESFFAGHIPDKGRVPVGEHQLVIMGRVQLSFLGQSVHFMLDRICFGGFKKAFPDEVTFVAPGEELLLYGRWEAVVGCSGRGQLAGMAGVEPGPGGLVGEILAGDGGYQGLLDLIGPIGRPIVGEAPVMEEIV
jgi:hypothetical protein